MTLTGPRLELLRRALHACADEASNALSRWIDRPARLGFDGIDQLPVAEATGMLGSPDAPVCCCGVALQGALTGHLLLVFDDASGFALADQLLGEAPGHTTEWTELATSAALETANIVCCAYLNALVRSLGADGGASVELVPTPPQFARDYADSLLEFALMEQFAAGHDAVFARTAFQIDGAPVDWTLLLVPDPGSLEVLELDPS